MQKPMQPVVKTWNHCPYLRAGAGDRHCHSGAYFAKTISNVREVKARGAL